MKWSILILSQPSREKFLARLLKILRPQVRGNPEVEIKLRMFDKELDLGSNRQVLVDEAHGDYVSFVDDDDIVASDYVQKILPLLDGVDMVGFRVECFIDGVKQLPTYHSLKLKGWFSDKDGLYRDISHINPIRKVLAMQVRMEGNLGEDCRWAEKMRELGIVKTEHYLDEVFYRYFYRSEKTDVVWA